MSNGAVSRNFAAISVIAAAVGISAAAAQGIPLRENQYTDYLQTNDFNGEAVALACGAAEWPVISFRANADEKNLGAFLAFLQVRPRDVRYFNNGQFSQTVSAFGEAVKDVCANTRFEKTEAELIFLPPTNFDPLVDGINLSYFRFDYQFQHHQPSGYLPLERRNFPVLTFEVEYDDENYPGRNDDVWNYQTSEMTITVNNYEYFRAPESGRPGAVRQEAGSYPCYYVDPNFNGVYRYAWKDCNPDTLETELPPGGTNLRNAVYQAAINFIEQNIDVAPEPVRVEDEYDEEVCCLTNDGIFAITNLNQCRVDENDVYLVQPTRICGGDSDADYDDDGEYNDDAGDDGPSPFPGSDGKICCQDYSGINPNIYDWKERLWCEDKDDHRVVANSLCR